MSAVFICLFVTKKEEEQCYFRIQITTFQANFVFHVKIEKNESHS